MGKTIFSTEAGRVRGFLNGIFNSRGPILWLLLECVIFDSLFIKREIFGTP